MLSLANNILKLFTFKFNQYLSTFNKSYNFLWSLTGFANGQNMFSTSVR